MVTKKTIRDLDPHGRVVLVRVDFNVPLDGGSVADDTRIRAALPTIRALRAAGGRLVLCSHLGRPKGKVVPEMSLRPAAERLATLIEHPVAFSEKCVGDDVHAGVAAMGDGDLLLLENLRYHKGETDNDRDFAQALASPAELFVNDAFGSAHRAHASTAGVTEHLSPCVSGLLLERELRYLEGALQAPASPFVVILGGAKISGKIEVLTNLAERADTILVGGGMVFTFLAARGLPVGSSLLEMERIETANEVTSAAESAGCKLLLPVDFLIADRFAEDASTRTIEATGGVPEGWMGLDIGPRSVELFAVEVSRASTVVWNGPMGVFEMAPFREGTMALARAMAAATDAGTTTIVGGADSTAALNLAKLGDRMTHVSTGGGASLELLEGKTLPGVAALDDA
ncbi:MAG: phosphoglycerate kinase [Gemmatimonadetes bacterium]|nr:phosphoglycerate kinase [Gemmatimonadota bacterium]